MYFRSVNHPHGMFATNRRRDFGFVRISKCGSNTMKNHFALFDWVPFYEEADFPRMLCCLRDPYDRFLSSIPETLKRMRLPLSIDTISSGFEGDVVVCPEFYRGVGALDFSESVSFVSDFLSLIEKLGFVDAHHEPQVNFLCDKDGVQEVNPELFMMAKMQAVAASLPGYNEQKWIVGNNRGQGFGSQGINQGQRPWMKGGLVQRGRRIKEVFLNGEKRVRISSFGEYPVAHPINKLIGGSNIPFGSLEVDVALANFYSLMKKNALDERTKQRIRNLYRGDFELVDAVRNRTAGSKCVELKYVI